MSYRGRKSNGRNLSGLCRSIEKYLDLPDDIFSGGLTAELRGRHELLVCGCTSILEYSDTEIRLAVKQGVVTVCGSGLELCSYGCGNAGVHGTIDSISFLDPEDGNVGGR